MKKMNRAVFLDRDGVILENKEAFLTDKKDMVLVKNAYKAIKKFNQLGYRVIVITNQPQVARGLCTEKDIKKINSHMSYLFKKRGARIDAIYYCPHHPEKRTDIPASAKKYRIACACRKPSIALLEKAAKKFSLSLPASFMVGDRTVDIKCGRDAGCKTILVKTGFAGKDNKHPDMADFLCKNVYEASKLVEKLSKINAVILVGGRGERLRPLSDKIPKPMLPVKGKPVLQYQIELLSRYGIQDIVICGYYLFHVIKKYFGDGKKFGVRIKYVEEKEPLGTGGAIKNAEKFLEKNFIVVYGDVVTNLNINNLVNFHFSRKALATLVLRHTDHPKDSDIVDIDEKGKILNFYSKDDTGKKGNVANTAISMLNKNLLKFVPKKSSLEKDVIRPCVGSLLYGYISNEYIRDMGTYERYLRVKKDLKKVGI